MLFINDCSLDYTIRFIYIHVNLTYINFCWILFLSLIYFCFYKNPIFFLFFFLQRYDESTKECRWEIGIIPPNMSSEKLELRGRVAIHELSSGSSSSGGSETKTSTSGSPSSSLGTSPTTSSSSSIFLIQKKDRPPVHYNSIPMRLEFSIPKSNVSGLQLSNINIKNVKYKANKMSRMHTRSGTYEMRL